MIGDAMESKTMMMNQEQDRPGTKKMMKTIRVKVPSKSPSSSSSSQNLRERCDRKVSCCSTELLFQNHSNFKRSGQPARIMYYEDGSWIDFEGEVVRSMQSEFLDKRPTVEASLGGSRYLFDFLRMLQIDFVTGKQRSIAWIDVNGKCFFPTSFVGDDFMNISESLESEDLENLKIEIEVRVNEKSNSNSVSGKRKRKVVELDDEEEEQSEDSSSNNQANLLKKPRVVTQDNQISRWPNARLVKEGESAHAVVRKFFLSGVRNVDAGARITSIYQCTRSSPMERARWEVYKNQMEIMKEARGSANTIFAWYGTSVRGVASILMHGFGMPAKVSGSEAYGIGIYLSPVSLPHMSIMQSEADENGEKHVILCRVILGTVEKVEAGSQQSHPSSMNFDTGVDDLRNPKRYIVWCANMNTHIIPECVVSYKSFDSLSARLGGSAFMNWVPNATNSTVVKLFSKLMSSLPSEKTKDLESLCNTYKAGIMTKESFIKQLRVISGDEMLLTTIRETRGSK